MADREPENPLGALPSTRASRRSSRRASAGASNRPKAAPGTGGVDGPDPAAITPVGDHAASSGLAADAAQEQPKAAPRKAAPKRGGGAGPKGVATPGAAARPKAAAKAKAAPTGRPKIAAVPDAPPVQPSPPPAGYATAPPDRQPQSPDGKDLVGGAVQAAGELAQLGVEVGKRAVRGVLGRLPRP